MTVKGMHFNNYNKQAAMMGEEQISSPIKHNGASNGPTSRDSNLNNYKLSQVCTEIIAVCFGFYKFIEFFLFACFTAAIKAFHKFTAIITFASRHDGQ